MIKIKICNEEFNVSEIFCLLTLIKLRDLVIIVRLSVISLRKKRKKAKKIYIIEPIPVLARPAGQDKSIRLHNVVQLWLKWKFLNILLKPDDLTIKKIYVMKRKTLFLKTNVIPDLRLGWVLLHKILRRLLEDSTIYFVENLLSISI